MLLFQSHSTTLTAVTFAFSQAAEALYCKVFYNLPRKNFKQSYIPIFFTDYN